MFPFSIPWTQRELQRDLDQHIQALPWSRDFELQPDELDSDHYKVWGRINALLRVLPTGDDYRIRMAFASLAAIARNHFASEEARMRDTRFRGLEEHSQRHVELTRKLGEVRFSHLSPFGLGRQLGAFTVLERWFVPHLTHDDRRLAEFLNAPASVPPKDADGITELPYLTQPFSLQQEATVRRTEVDGRSWKLRTSATAPERTCDVVSAAVE